MQCFNFKIQKFLKTLLIIIFINLNFVKKIIIVRVKYVDK
jgi:hypothetical protein